MSSDNDGNSVGGVLPCLRAKLKDVPEMGFFSSKEPPAGVLHVKGSSVFLGYFKKPELTRQVLDQDGWLNIGDVAVLQKNGSLQLLDRVTEIVKLQNGNFVSPLKLETIYLQAPILDQIFVHINPNYAFLVAIVHLNEDKLKQFAMVNNLQKPAPDLLKLKEVEMCVLTQLERIAKENGLTELEEIRKILIIDQPFTVKSGLLTNT